MDTHLPHSMHVSIDVTVHLDQQLDRQINRLIDLLSQTADLTALAAQLKTSNDALAAAVAANTPKDAA